MPVVSGYDVTFVHAAPGRATDEELLLRISAALSERGFQAKHLGLGSSGMETCYSLARGPVHLALICSTLDESQVGFWHAPPWFWQRLFRRKPTHAEIEQALDETKDVCQRILGTDAMISGLRIDRITGPAAEQRVAADKAHPGGPASAGRLH